MLTQLFSKSGLLSIHGRLNRKAYLYVIALIFAILMVEATIEMFVESLLLDSTQYITTALSRISQLCCIYISTVNTAKRMQDLNYNGLLAIPLSGLGILTSCFKEQEMITTNINYFIFLLDGFSIYPILWVVEIILFVIGLILMFKKGTDGDNKYGPDPLQYTNGEPQAQ